MPFKKQRLDAETECNPDSCELREEDLVSCELREEDLVSLDLKRKIYSLDTWQARLQWNLSKPDDSGSETGESRLEQDMRRRLRDGAGPRTLLRNLSSVLNT